MQQDIVTGDAVTVDEPEGSRKSQGFAPAVLRETLVYTAGVAGAALIAFLATPIYTRAMGPEAYGQLALALAIVAPLVAVAQLGLDVALSRYWFEVTTVRERRDLSTSLLVFAGLWSVLLSALGAALILVARGLFGLDWDFAVLLLIALATLLPAQLFAHLQQILRNQFRPIAFASTAVAGAFLGTGLGLGLVLGLGMGPAGALLGTVAAGVIGSLLALPLVRKMLAGRAKWSIFMPLARLGIPLVPASLAFWIFSGFDRIVVGDRTDELGAYAVAGQIAIPLSLVVTAIGQAWLPRVINEHSTAPERVDEVVTVGTEAALAVLGSIAAVMGLAAPLLIGIVGGPGYGAGATALPLLLAANAFLGASLMMTTGAVLAKKTKRLPFVSITAAAVDIVLLLLLVDRWGLVGAGFSLMVTYIVMAWLALAYSQSVFPLPFRYGRLVALSVLVATQAVLVAVAPTSPISWALACTPIVWAVCLALRLLRSSRTGTEPELTEDH